ncbi:MAG: hypothetical protein ACLTS6_03920 [Anaerobutyricum sp.]
MNRNRKRNLRIAKLSGIIKEYHSDDCLDYAKVQGNPWNHLSDDRQSSAKPKHIFKELSKYMKRSGLMNQK